ncbi:MAG: sigma-70 family RNA polymerase sigma factor [Anaerolineae bacterium]
MSIRLAITGDAPTTGEGEAVAFARLYQEHLDGVFNYCVYRVGDPVAAEDLTADIFERAWRARRRYSPGQGKFSTWLYTIARRRVIDWQRRQARRRTVVLDEQLASSLPGPEALSAEAEDRRRLRQLVQDLPEVDQELIAMKFGAGMTNRDIAALLGKSESAVGSAVFRLVRKLRTLWEETR